MKIIRRGTRPTDQGPVQWRRLQPGDGSDGGVVSSRDWVLGLHGDYSVWAESRSWLNPSGDWVRAQVSVRRVDGQETNLW